MCCLKEIYFKHKNIKEWSKIDPVNVNTKTTRAAVLFSE